MIKDRYIIWDIDGVKYPHTERFNRLCCEVQINTVQRLIPNLPYTTAKDLVEGDPNGSNNCYSAFMPLAAQSGLTAEAFRLKIFKTYHKELFSILMAREPGFFEESKQMRGVFQDTSGRIGHGVLSHSDMENWTIPILKKIGTFEFFNPNALLGLDQFNWVTKPESTAPLLMALNRLGAEPHQSFFCEDSLRNLERATEVRGLHLIYIHHGKPLDQLPSHITAQFVNPKDAVVYADKHPLRPEKIFSMPSKLHL